MTTVKPSYSWIRWNSS